MNYNYLHDTEYYFVWNEFRLVFYVYWESSKSFISIIKVIFYEFVQELGIKDFRKILNLSLINIINYTTSLISAKVLSSC